MGTNLQRGIIDGLTEFVIGGTASAASRAVHATATRRAAESGLGRLYNTLFAQRPDDVPQEEWSAAIAPYVGEAPGAISAQVGQ
jgi:hypothetical protein